jgi:DNA methylase
MQVAFERWTQGRDVPTLGTNAGAQPLPFQQWRNFKEAFAPELVARAIAESGRRVERCIDPFGGSGTTALTCQFLNVEPVTIEVNPYLCDLIEAKLADHDPAMLLMDFRRIKKDLRQARRHDLSHLPPTFVEPGVNGRWLYPELVAQQIEAYRAGIAALDNALHRRFFLALLGGVVVELSNVLVSGKGRRYRQNWMARQATPEAVGKAFTARVEMALIELTTHAYRPVRHYTLLRGDSRQQLRHAPRADLAVFSPPYPNSFDYTDVYNVELWMLGYLNDVASNRLLRQSTLTSHVQVARQFAAKPAGSRILNKVSKRLHADVDALWSRHIPAMVDGYFADMRQIMADLQRKLYVGGEIWAVVGDSLYNGTLIPVADVLKELALDMGLEWVKSEAFRSMRSSAQQGWRAELNETLLVLRKRSAS